MRGQARPAHMHPGPRRAISYSMYRPVRYSMYVSVIATGGWLDGQPMFSLGKPPLQYSAYVLSMPTVLLSLLPHQKPALAPAAGWPAIPSHGPHLWRLLNSPRTRKKKHLAMEEGRGNAPIGSRQYHHRHRLAICHLPSA
ncbi:hypothetical protein P3342_013474 [Pyrenophora teres f. teres]|nr:hypothetical protein P3342_013474 [Pyrenophora teres f. teres]